MENKYFDIKETLYDITEKYPESIELLVSIGFDNIKDESQRKTMGRAITLENALNMKKINVENFTTPLSLKKIKMIPNEIMEFKKYLSAVNKVSLKTSRRGLSI